MKIRKSFLFGLIVSILYLCDAGAKTRTCPAGCFCLNNGKYESPLTEKLDDACKISASYISSPEQCWFDGALWYGYVGGVSKWIACTDAAKEQHKGYVTYIFNDFSELYYGNRGAYGYVNNELVYLPRMEDEDKTIYNCPEKYPLSEAGAKSLFECYSYDDKGNKVYYKKSSGNYSGNSGNVNTETIKAMVEDLQESLNKTNKIAQELQNALNKSNNKYSTSSNFLQEAKLFNVMKSANMKVETSQAKAMIDSGVVAEHTNNVSQYSNTSKNVKSSNADIDAMKAMISAGITDTKAVSDKQIKKVRK